MNKLIIGLGNPGKKYKNTRHNAGFMAINYCADQWQGQFPASSNADAQIADVMISGQKVKFVKPHTFMNKSGLAVRKLADYFNVSPENILIIHDDIALPLGALRVSQGSSAGGHNGVKSIINALGTQKFTRLRIGIDDRSGQSDIDTQSYVLGRFTKEQKQTVKDKLSTVHEAIKTWATKNPEAVMNKVNG